METTKLITEKWKDHSGEQTVHQPHVGSHAGKCTRKGEDCQILFMKIFLNFSTPTKPGLLSILSYEAAYATLKQQTPAGSCSLENQTRTNAESSQHMPTRDLGTVLKQRNHHLFRDSPIPPAYLLSDALGSGQRVDLHYRSQRPYKKLLQLKCFYCQSSMCLRYRCCLAILAHTTITRQKTPVV